MFIDFDLNIFYFNFPWNGIGHKFYNIICALSIHCLYARSKLSGEERLFRYQFAIVPAVWLGLLKRFRFILVRSQDISVLFKFDLVCLGTRILF